MVPRIALVVTALAFSPLACGSDDSTGATGGSGQDGGGAATDGGGTGADGSLSGDGGKTGGDGGPVLPGDGGTSCPIFPADNPWNTNISDTTAFPADANSAVIIDYLNTHVNDKGNVVSGSPATKLHPDFGSDPTFGIPYLFVPGTEPKIPVTFDVPDESDPGPYPIPLNAPIEAPSDSHTLAVDTDNCLLYELDQADPGSTSWSAFSGAKFDLRSNALRTDHFTSADAAGLPIFAGLVRKYEVDAGVIPHALRFTVEVTAHKFVHPATHAAGGSGVDESLGAPMGMRMRLKSTFDTSGYTGAAKVILVALQQYGMFVADNGSNWYISGETNTSWNDAELEPLKKVPVDSTNFEVIQIGTRIDQ